MNDYYANHNLRLWTPSPLNSCCNVLLRWGSTKKCNLSIREVKNRFCICCQRWWLFDRKTLTWCSHSGFYRHPLMCGESPNNIGDVDVHPQNFTIWSLCIQNFPLKDKAHLCWSQMRSGIAKKFVMMWWENYPTSYQHHNCHHDLTPGLALSATHSHGMNSYHNDPVIMQCGIYCWHQQRTRTNAPYSMQFPCWALTKTSLKTRAAIVNEKNSNILVYSMNVLLIMLCRR
jgi:hypothetical protein